MNFPSNNSGESRKKFSRGQFLRDSVITASGIALMPSILSSCNKLDYQPGKGPGKGYGSGPAKGWGGTPTLTDLENAAANLDLMLKFMQVLYPFCIEYENEVFLALDSTKDNANWANFIGNIFIDIGVGMAGAIAIASGGSLALPAFACFAAFLKDWGLGKGTPSDLAGTFALFVDGHNSMEFYIEQKLRSLADPTNNYSNLLTQWENVIELNGKSYTLKDLANSTFPGKGDEYNALQTEAYTHFKKSLWNLSIMKCCTYFENYHRFTETPHANPGTFYSFIQNTFYPHNKGVYVRAKWEGEAWDLDDNWEYVYYNLGIRGYALPDAASSILFMDDTPGHIINPNGLFNRSYVFEQFSTTKPKFLFDEMASYPNYNTDTNSNNNDWDFNGGFFPILAKLTP